MTPTDMQLRISAGRAVMNYVAANDRYDILDGVNLNLNFPSVVGTVQVGEREIRAMEAVRQAGHVLEKLQGRGALPADDPIVVVGMDDRRARLLDHAGETGLCPGPLSPRPRRNPGIPSPRRSRLRHWR